MGNYGQTVDQFRCKDLLAASRVCIIDTPFQKTYLKKGDGTTAMSGSWL